MDNLVRERRTIFFYRWLSQFTTPYDPQASVYKDVITTRKHIVRICEDGALQIHWTDSDIQTFNYTDLYAISLLNHEFEKLSTQHRVFVSHFADQEDAQHERTRREHLLTMNTVP